MLIICGEVLRWGFGGGLDGVGSIINYQEGVLFLEPKNCSERIGRKGETCSTLFIPRYDQLYLWTIERHEMAKTFNDWRHSLDHETVKTSFNFTCLILQCSLCVCSRMSPQKRKKTHRCSVIRLRNTHCQRRSDKSRKNSSSVRVHSCRLYLKAFWLSRWLFAVDKNYETIWRGEICFVQVTLLAIA